MTLRSLQPPLLFAASLLLTDTFATSAATAPAPRGLVACYRFESSANDDSGLGLHGKALSGVVFSDDAIEGARSAEFDGLGSRIVVPHHPSLAISGDLTLAAWVNVRAESFAAKPNILSKSFNHGYRLRLNTDGTPCLLLGNGSASPAQVNGTRPLRLTEWTHVAVTVTFRDNRAAVRFFLNGVADPEPRFVKLAAIETGDGPLVLGTSWDRPGAHDSLLGRLDQVTIHNHALPPEEIARLAAVNPPAAASFLQ